MRQPTQEDLIRALERAGIRDQKLLEAFRAVPREAFVPPEYAREAYHDRPLPIPHDQVTTQPSLSAKMIEALALKGGERVLEVGTGYGFQTAILAQIAGFVWSVERWPDIAATARDILARQGITNVEVIAGDGTEGLPEHAPYDAILVSAAFPTVPQPLIDQLAEGGRLVQPIGPGSGDDVTLFEKRREGLVRLKVVTPAYFVRLYGRHGYPD